VPLPTALAAAASSERPNTGARTGRTGFGEIAHGYADPVATERRLDVGFGASLALMAAGAILLWAVNVDTSGVDLNTVGAILLVIGAIGLAFSLVFWSSWGGWGPWRRPPEDRYYADRY
jgi:hypothetical protein